MKKIGKLLIILIGSIPLICNAQVEKEVNYKWYTLIEDNIHYENDAEQVCEYFDKSNYITGDWKYSIKKPEDKEYRTIKREIQEVHFGREYFNTLKINYFNISKDNIEIYEFEILDKDNNPIKKQITNVQNLEVYKIFDEDINTSGIIHRMTSVTLEFDKLINIRDIKLKMTYKDDNMDVMGITYNILVNGEVDLNALSNAEMLMDTNCEDGICIQEMVTKENIYNEDKIIPTYIYKYQDKAYKCYDLKKLYVPGYYKELEGFIKDEDNFIEITKEISIETNTQTTDKKEEPKKEIIDNSSKEKQEEQDLANTEENNKEEQEDLDKNENLNNNKDAILNKPIAIVTKENSKEETESILPYVVCLVALIVLSILAYIIKKVVKSRTK